MAKKKTLKEAFKEVLDAEATATVEPTETEATTDTTVEEDADQVDETTAADSLHPAARSVDDPKSKLEMISKAIGAMHAMSSEELTKWYTQSIAQSQTYSDKIPGGASTKNTSTLDMNPSAASSSTGPKTKDAMPKLGVKEDLDEMLEGFDLTEEFKDRASVLFEAALNARVILEVERLEEEFDARVEEAVGEMSEALADQIDNYLNYVVEHFMEENKVAIESSLRNELVSEFIEGMKNLFQEHYIEVPETKVDVVEALTDKITDLESKFNEQLEENAQLRESLVEVEREKLVDTYIEGMALSEADKFLKLVEGVDFDGDLEAYSKKLSVIKETYLKKDKKAVQSNIVEESFEGDAPTKPAGIDPTVAQYLNLINNSIKA